jgi:hypothetical protein
VTRLLAIAVALFFLPVCAAADDLTPKEIYLRSLSTMHALPEKAFLAFSYEWTQVVDDNVHSGSAWTMTLQTSTGNAHMVNLSGGKVLDEPFSMRPDLLIAHPAPAATPAASAFSLGVDVDSAEKLPTIAVVVARPIHYQVTLVNHEAVRGCADAYHLKLVPTTDPDRNNLRELWVDTATFQACKALAAWKAGVVNGHIFPITFAVYFDERGFVTSWTAEGTMGKFLAKAHYAASGSYDDLRQLDASPIAGWPQRAL